MSPSRRRRRVRLTRDLVLFATALGLLIFEVVARDGRDPGVLEICGLLLLAPGVLRTQEWQHRRGDDE